ncbi:glycoside hydrolase family 3 N-terminal domain-containing protein [Streptomyces sp. CBMA123]|uniref:glycoside hydrolase family 3 N-terminal domain-containing protein n=1 Tax=Streptomyces sp. CBMA123 TaxID=1896313 RepID=UPI001661BDD1|nr:glycoside hydrolase family 3 N-terminal domain-containing protein [Streptomyces sp. CBMA123]MBD0691581.1 beta-N-acetylhexosaminidase [Streptomyces sp. CBMA123]
MTTVLVVLAAALGPAPAGSVTRGSELPGERTLTMAGERMTGEQQGDSRQLAGRRIVLSYPGPTPAPEVLRAIREGRAAGVILFGENVTSPEQLAEAVGQLKQAAAEAAHPRPLLLMTDQEGGKVRRLPGAPELSARRTGSAPNPLIAAVDSGTGAAGTLADAGLNVNLAPVLDVYDTPGNFIDRFERSYGQDPTRVGELGSAFLATQQSLGVAATAKHFPGLGAAAHDENTDARPVTLPVPLDRLRTRDEAPYRAAIAAGVRLVMASWAVYPALDPDRPAGMSPTVIQGELRDRLGFDGVTVTDALEADALTPYGPAGRRAVVAAAAGMDLILCSARDPRQGEDATTALAAALDSGDLDRAAFAAAVDRVDALRESLG